MQQHLTAVIERLARAGGASAFGCACWRFCAQAWLLKAHISFGVLLSGAHRSLVLFDNRVAEPTGQELLSAPMASVNAPRAAIFAAMCVALLGDNGCFGL